MAKISGTAYTPHSFGGLVLNCMIKAVLGAIIAFIVYSAFTIIAVGCFTRVTGYTVLFSENGENYTEVYSHSYDDGEDTRLATYEKDERYYKMPVRSTLSAQVTTVVRWLAQAAALALLYAMLYGVLWRTGDSDANKAEFGGAPLDWLRGLKIGLAADIPFIATYVMLLVVKAFSLPDGFIRAFKIINYGMFALNDTLIPVTAGGFVFTWGRVLGLAAVLLPIPLICAFAYRMGNKRVMFKDRLIYKSTKNDK